MAESTRRRREAILEMARDAFALGLLKPAEFDQIQLRLVGGTDCSIDGGVRKPSPDRR